MNLQVVESQEEKHPEKQPTRPWNVIAPLQHVSQEQLKIEYKKYSDQAVMVALNMLSDANIGLIVRTAACFSLGSVYVVGRRNYPAHTAVGTQNHIDVHRVTASTGPHNEFLSVERLKEFFDEQKNKYTLIFIEQHPGSIPLSKFNFNLKKPPMFIFGTESDGIPTELIDAFPESYTITIEQLGISRSLNVAVASGIVGYAWSQYKSQDKSA